MTCGTKACSRCVEPRRQTVHLPAANGRARTLQEAPTFEAKEAARPFPLRSLPRRTTCNPYKEQSFQCSTSRSRLANLAIINSWTRAMFSGSNGPDRIHTTRGIVRRAGGRRIHESSDTERNWCSFSTATAGTRQGRVVLAQHREISDARPAGDSPSRLTKARRSPRRRPASQSHLAATIQLRRDMRDRTQCGAGRRTWRIIAQLVAVNR